MWMVSYKLYSEKEDGKKYEKAFCTFYSKVKDKDTVHSYESRQATHKDS